ncbi:beta-galactosidase, partial [Nonomuraea sp. NPDC050691]|uniref:beta-galactosidase n=1 Tax=Nonomuraea sp. NPDC050691 TaxID=3155661 RepID=UPI0033E4A8BC
MPAGSSRRTACTRRSAARSASACPTRDAAGTGCAATTAWPPGTTTWRSTGPAADHTLECFCPESARHFRAWLQARYGTADGLN